MLYVNQIMYAKKMHYMIPSNLIGFFGNITLNILLIPIWGALGAVAATTLTSLIQGLVTFQLGQKSYYLKHVGKKIFILFSISFIFTAGLYYLMFSEYSIVIKIMSKSSIILCFLYFCVKFNYIPYENGFRVFRNVFRILKSQKWMSL